MGSTVAPAGAVSKNRGGVSEHDRVAEVPAVLEPVALLDRRGVDQVHREPDVPQVVDQSVPVVMSDQRHFDATTASNEAHSARMLQGM